MVEFNFNRKNTDPGLAGETTHLTNLIPALNDLYARLVAYGLQDQVCIALQNVFGRTLSTKNHSGNADGRNHNAEHHVSVFIGKPFKSAVIGGVTLNSAGNDYRAVGFDSASGAPADTNGDVAYGDTLASVGKTLGKALGVPESVLDLQITSTNTNTVGKAVPVIGAALV